MHIQLSDHFTYRKLIKFTLPSIVMMIFTSIYGVVDGFFVSNFAGKTSFAAVNFIMPFLMILGCVGFMFGTGGSALIAKTIGEGDREKANSQFSLLIYTSFALGVIIAAVGLIFIRPLTAILGAEGQLLEDCIRYGRIILLALPFFILQMEFQSFFVTAEKPNLGLYAAILSGVANIVLDALLVGVFSFELLGAAAATAISQAIGAAIPLVYFMRPNTSLLRIGRPKMDWRALLLTCTNGSSELMSNISMSLVSMLYNIQLYKFAGENGVAAYGVLMYVNFVFLSAFIGYVVGSAPIVSYHYGANNHSEMRNIRKKSLVLITLCSIFMLFFSECLAIPFSKIFVGYDAELYELTVRGFFIYSFSFLFAGIAIFGSSFFTALNNGLVSAIISFLRTLVFQTAAVLLLPIFIGGINGIWLSIVIAELMAAIISVIFMIALRRKYHY